MSDVKKKKSRIFDYFVEKEELYAGGLAWCAGGLGVAYLTLRRRA